MRGGRIINVAGRGGEGKEIVEKWIEKESKNQCGNTKQEVRSNLLDEGFDPGSG